MHCIDHFLNNIEDESTIEVILRLHDSILIQHPSMTVKLRYKIPFYDVHTWICYLNPIKNKGIELVFLKGQQMKTHEHLLVKKGRKMVSGISFYRTSEIETEVLSEILQEAILLDEIDFQSKIK
ncbi:MAG TPA: DUF1801 domain-containing protein [Saprospiraceae bacterium]|nr:DUF1801 domain-containing protein [Saprospiraceae bacterium]